METKKKLRCPIGVPGAAIASIIGLVGVVANIMEFSWLGMITSFGLLLIALPFMRVTMMVHSANDRLDELENKIK